MINRWRKFQVGIGRGRAGFHGKWLQALTSVGNGADTTEDNLQTVTLEANGLYKLGQLVRIRCAGRTGANGNNKTFQLYFGGTSILTTGALASNALNWWVEAMIWRTGSKTQTAFAWGVFNGALIAPARTTLTKDDTATIIIKGTGQSSVATANDIQQDILDVSVETL